MTTTQSIALVVVGAEVAIVVTALCLPPRHSGNERRRFPRTGLLRRWTDS